MLKKWLKIHFLLDHMKNEANTSAYLSVYLGRLPLLLAFFFFLNNPAFHAGDIFIVS